MADPEDGGHFVRRGVRDHVDGAARGDINAEDADEQKDDAADLKHGRKLPVISSLHY